MHTLPGPRGGGSDFNVVALDELVSEYLAAQAHHHGSDNEDAGAADGAAPGASSAAAAAASAAPDPQAHTWAVRRLLERGRVGEAVDLIQRACPEILEDQRLLFRLERQQFTELLRQGTLDGDARALECARQQLAPLALHAYPEAFTDFKTTMLMLMQRQPPRGSDGGGTGSSGGAQDAAAAGGRGAAAAAAVAAGGGGSGSTDAEWFWDTSDGREHPSEAAAHAHCRGRPGVWVQGRRRRGGGGASAARAARRGGGGDSGGGLMEGARAARSVAARGELAETVFHTMRQRLGWLDPSLSLVIRYLLLVASAHAESSAANAGLSGPDQELADRLLQRAEPGGAPLRDAAPLPNEASGMSFPEMDILALMHAARISRTAAWDSLKRAGGTAASALKDELMRLRLEHSVLLPLAEEYAAYRGLCAAGEGGEGPGDEEEGEDGSDDGAGGDGMDVDNTASTGGDAAAGSGGAAGGGGRGEAEGRRPRSTQPAAAAAEGGAGAAAAGGAAVGGTQWARCDSRSPPYKVPRWLAQQSATGFNPSDGSSGDNAGSGAAEPLPPTAAAVAAAAAGKRRRAAAAALRERHAPLLQLQAAARAGRWSEAESLLEAAAPGLLRSKRPELMFDLQRARFAQLVNAGDLASALTLARTEMTPLADAHPPLLPALKAAMGSLLPGGGIGGSGGAGVAGGRAAPDATALGAALHEVMAEALGLQGPRLASLLRALLSVHKSWFKMQRCADPFASALGLTRLRSPDDRPPSAADGAGVGATAAAPDAAAGTAADAAAAPGGAAAAGTGRAAGAAAAGGGGGGGGSNAGGLGLPPMGGYEGDEDSGEDDEGEEVDESSILRLMEILEIPRGLAIELLVQHHGSVEDAVMQVVAG